MVGVVWAGQREGAAETRGFVRAGPGRGRDFESGKQLQRAGSIQGGVKPDTSAQVGFR